ncbi:MAG: DUF368 domain-containing protein [Myxococcota bacterium]
MDSSNSIESPDLVPSSTAPAVPETGEAVHDIDVSDAPYTVFSGFCMGTADVVPGVSGGTMAVALGIYHQLLAAITSADKMAVASLLRFDLKALFGRVHWRFIGALLTGLALGLILMVKVVKLPLLIGPTSDTRPLVYAIFFGMVLGSAVTLGTHIKTWGVVRPVAMVAGIGIGFLVVTRVPVDTPDHPAFIFLCGSIAICAMLLPGISGSFILLILRKYAFILGAVSALQLSVVAPFLAGCVFGLLAFSRVLKWLLDRYHDTVLASLIGLLIGSLWRIWPYQDLTVEIIRHKPRVLAATPVMPTGLEITHVLALLGGLAFVVGIEFYAKRRSAKAPA